MAQLLRSRDPAIATLLLVAAVLLAACEACSPEATPADSNGVRRAKVFLTSRAGDAMRETGDVAFGAPSSGAAARITVHPDRERQLFHGVGGSLTQASAAALAALSPEKRAEVLARKRRGLAGTVTTSPRGLLSLSDWAPKRKSLLGE